MVGEQIGAIIETGPSDWQIVQQNAEGWGEFALGGRWVAGTAGRVEVRLVFEDTSVPVSRALDWQAAETLPDGRWTARLRAPAGGLYRLETRFNPAGNLAGEWSARGDMRHFLGVGDLWVIAGQSNAAGYGRGPVYDPPEFGVHLFRNSEQWALATQPLNEATDTRHPANREEANPGHSPYLHCARLLKQALHYPIGLVQTALGGSALAAWNPAEPGGAALFHNMVHCVERAGGRVRGVLWYQGETDADGAALSATYGERFAQAVAAWRTALGDGALPVLTVQLNRYYTPPSEELQRGWSEVREAQRQAARRLPGVSVVPTLDLPLSDSIHTGPAGNLLLAERLARAALGAVYGRPCDYRAPDVESARAIDGGRTIELSFQPVTSRMDNVDPTANCFAVQDAAGPVPVVTVVYPGNATVQIVLGRALAGKAAVHGAWGLNPPSAPMDMERSMPMLAFYNVAVEPA